LFFLGSPVLTRKATPTRDRNERAAPTASTIADAACPTQQFGVLCSTGLGDNAKCVQRSLRQLIDAFDPSLPLERARTIPSDWYRSPELAELERWAVFGDGWQLVARTDQLVRPGELRHRQRGG
jgi:hypothetical protein